MFTLSIDVCTGCLQQSMFGNFGKRLNFKQRSTCFFFAIPAKLEEKMTEGVKMTITLSSVKSSQKHCVVWCCQAKSLEIILHMAG